ncbi:hypothetical protein BCR37DRAFT_386837 [Protomyces lactucae-debilis]|uniref:Rhodopsin domain-containing protein n=1 Tax=Protomyces lactucae-debilis TaxID=2754530 RepID=A0A1Y2FKF4_PROLT|nr:uncharacterized protein BCR37DRAFT_386837 [Protomyces lactucae-debilis]ORY83844.1 hypothetical protein BCR37DRAFT_386837 [Protomyces lactucae-debilis]
MMDWTAALIAPSTVLFVVSTVFFTARIHRSMLRSPLAIIDTAIISLAASLVLASFILLLVMAGKGNLRAYDDTNLAAELAMERVQKQLFYAFAILVRAGLALSKLSLAINFFEASQLVNRSWYKWLTLGVVVVMVFNISTAFISAFRCLPISDKFSTGLEDQTWASSHCIDKRVFFIVQGLVACATTGLVTCVGVPLVWRVSSRFKIVGFTMLFMGLVCISVSILQLSFIFTWDHEVIDPALAHWRQNRWMSLSQCTMYLLFLCACVPRALANLFQRRQSLRTMDAPTGMTGDEKDQFSSVAVSTMQSPTSPPPGSTFPAGFSPMSMTFPGVVSSGFGGDALDLRDMEDTSDWLAPTSPLAASFEQRLGAFQQRRGEWEDLYQTDTLVQIRSFEQQFPTGTISELPFASSAIPDQERDIEADPIAKTDLQKAYFDEMAQFRQHFDAQAQRFGSRDLTSEPGEPSTAPRIAKSALEGRTIAEGEIVMY